MGVCESALGGEKESPKLKEIYKTRNKGGNLYCAPINASQNNDNIYVDKSFSQMTMTMDMSQYRPTHKPQIYKYINKYKTNTLQRSLAKGSLVELGGKGNSLMNSNIKNSVDGPDSIYSSRCEDTGFESSYEGFEEMIFDGKIDEEYVKNCGDKNTLNIYNEFIGKKENNNNKKDKIMDYYHKSNSNKNANNVEIKKIGINLKECKEGDELSRIPSTRNNNLT